VNYLTNLPREMAVANRENGNSVLDPLQNGILKKVSPLKSHISLGFDLPILDMLKQSDGNASFALFRMMRH